MNIKKFIPDNFILLLLLAIIVGYFVPQLATWQLGFINLDRIIDIGVVGVFFFYGLKLDKTQLKNDFRRWPVHLLTQSISFVLFPLLVLIFYPLFSKTEAYQMMFIGLFFLASLPSTVSSSVVMVSIAKGNIISAIFNASLSGLIGIILTPLWMSIFTKSTASIDSSSVFIDLVIKILVPVMAGLFIQPWLEKFYQRHKFRIAKLDKLTIILIVYNSFAHTFHDGSFTLMQPKQLILIAVCVSLLFFVVLKISRWVGQKFGFSREDLITIQFCGTKKSLVHGSVFASVLFSENIGVYLLPIMIYHTFQLFIISFIAEKYAKQL
ncbi:bile acid:sodium symporter family protein [Weeksella virosa]|uniref:bile acid:sodium symporter family protein n=1 Tax=Weeksella virosa TaxID=1014 RepID=UPI00255606D6|nr:bile acid:sodium symporter family protein [Weeksella virosa]MDK7375483.1 bile acid:sodium symporter family protein [Weeksella virosa]